MNSSFYKIISLLSVAKLLCWQSFKATRIQRKVFDLISFSAVIIFYLITLGSGLEFGYIDVRDEEEGEEHTLLNHFVLDGNVAHANLLRFALTEQNVESTTVLVRFQQNDIYEDAFDDHCSFCDVGLHKHGSSLECNGSTGEVASSSPGFETF